MHYRSLSVPAIAKGAIAAGAVSVILSMASAMAAPITSNPVLSSGGNTFDSFTCSLVGPFGAAGPSSCAQIDVSSPGTAGPGNLQIQSDFVASGASSVDGLITYHVHSPAGISAVDLEFNASFLGLAVSSILEAIYTSPTFAPASQVGRLTVNCAVSACSFSDTRDPPLEAADIPLSGTFNDLYIRKDIAARGFVPGDQAFYSFIGQSFTTGLPPIRVPEPASLALLGSALVGFGIMRRRRKA
jgi:hypothetical protein